MSPGAVTIVASLGAINWLILETLWTKSKLKNGFRIYGAPKGLTVLFSIAIPLFVYGAIANGIENHHERWVSAILLGFAILGVMFFPATILLSHEKVVSLKWLGFKKIEMKWGQVDAVYSIPEDRSIVIQDKNDRHIVHTLLNVDREGFISELRALPPTVLNRITFQL